ncbi:MAG: VWA domain-containing protein [Rhodomicrobium sp.]
MAEALNANIVTATADGGRIASNIVGFARLLRAAGMPAGPQKAIEATEAVIAAGLDNPKAVYWALHAVFVNRPSEREIFNQAFHLVWRDPGYIHQLLSVMVPNFRGGQAQRDAVARRLADSLFLRRETAHALEREILQIDASGTASDLEVLASKDFEQMTADELRIALRAMPDVVGALSKRPTRRFEAAGAGRERQLDLRRMLHRLSSRGPEAMLPLYKRRRRRAPPLAVLCDISGSMDIYARVFLHFLYALINEGERVHAFLFGTRLTNVTRLLKGRDPDTAIAKASGAVQDWSGGTRIGESLHSFNKVWARRVLGQNAIVLLFTDGLDRAEGKGISIEARRLRASCRRLIWLNPLLRYEDYAPVAAGAGELRRHISEMRPCHNLRSVADLANALA